MSWEGSGGGFPSGGRSDSTCWLGRTGTKKVGIRLIGKTVISRVVTVPALGGQPVFRSLSFGRCVDNPGRSDLSADKSLHLRRNRSEFL
jgi:hypothetical protein